MARRRSGKAGRQSIDRSGRQIYEKGGRIKPLTDRRRDVESQSMGGMSYRVSLDCKPTCPACHEAFKKVFGALKGLFLHLCDIHIRNEFAKTKKQERVNSAFAGRTGPARGINSENSLVCHTFILYYIRPHGGIGGRTPAGAAGITILGHNKWA